MSTPQPSHVYWTIPLDEPVTWERYDADAEHLNWAIASELMGAQAYHPVVTRETIACPACGGERGLLLAGVSDGIRIACPTGHAWIAETALSQYLIRTLRQTGLGPEGYDRGQ